MQKLLSPAQITLLKERRGSCIDSYKPYLKLKELGLIESTPRGFNNVEWTITAAGEKMLCADTPSNQLDTTPPKNKTERFLKSFKSVVLESKHRNYGDQTPALRDLGMGPSIATALIRWGESEDLVCTFVNARGVGPNAYSWQPAFLSDAFKKHIEMFGDVGKSDLTEAMLEYAKR